MNVLLNLISMLGRYLYVLVAVAVLGVMPYSAWLAWNAYNAHHVAQLKLDEAKKLRAAQELQMEKIKEYRKYFEEVNGFLKVARDNRLEEQGWTSYEVAIKNRLTTVSEIRNLLTNAGPSSRFYFRPKRLEIVSLFAPDSLPEDLKKTLYGTKGQPAKALTEGEKLPVPGEKVVLSLSGTYLVFPRS